MAESTQKLPQELKDKFPDMPWRDISGFRNILVHDYIEGIDIDSILFIITTDLKLLKKVALQMKKGYSCSRL
jgi:uncharacterized protein with HEPN domain